MTYILLNYSYRPLKNSHIPSAHIYMRHIQEIPLIYHIFVKVVREACSLGGSCLQLLLLLYTYPTSKRNSDSIPVAASSDEAAFSDSNHMQAFNPNTPPFAMCANSGGLVLLSPFITPWNKSRSPEGVLFFYHLRKIVVTAVVEPNQMKREDQYSCKIQEFTHACSRVSFCHDH